MWGLVPVAVRFLLSDLSPASVLVLRLFPSGLIAVLLLVVLGMRTIAWRDWPAILVAALIGNVGYQVLVHFGVRTLPASWTGALFGLEPLFVTLLAVFLAGERLTLHLIVGLGIALAGVAALTAGALGSDAGEVGLGGLTLVAISTIGWGIYTVVLRPVARKYGSLQISCLSLAVSALPMAGFMSEELFRVLPALSLFQWAALAFLVVFGTFLAVIAWNHGAGLIGSARAGLFLYLQPLVAAAGGHLLLDESITWPLVAGGALIIAGVAVSQWRGSIATVQAHDLPGLDTRAAVSRLVARAREGESRN
jgi:drug/metabolite transporter (DMT)-like permease